MKDNENTTRVILRFCHHERITWQAIRELHPARWLLLEVLEAKSRGEERWLTNMAVLEQFGDSMSALRAYRELKRIQPSKELVVLHTSRADARVLQRHYVGVRGAA